MIEALDDELHAYRRSLGERAPSRAANDYLAEWTTADRGWLRRFVPDGSDQPAFMMGNSQPWGFSPSAPKPLHRRGFVWSGRRDSNSRPSPWQKRDMVRVHGCAAVHTVRPCQAHQSMQSVACFAVSRQLFNAFNYDWLYPARGSATAPSRSATSLGWPDQVGNRSLQ